MISFESITTIYDIFTFEIHLVLATLYGLLIGLERESLRKPAGLRTCAMVCLGSMLFTHLSVVAGILAETDSARIASNIVQGIGFLCGGTIIFFKDKLLGLTTAAVIWVVAAIGMSIGFGNLTEASEVAVTTLLILLAIGRIERMFIKRKTLPKKAGRIVV